MHIYIYLYKYYNTFLTASNALLIFYKPESKITFGLNEFTFYFSQVGLESKLVWSCLCIVTPATWQQATRMYSV